MANSPASDSATHVDQSKRRCGVVRPIAAMGDYPEVHWDYIGRLIKEVVTPLDFEVRLVSSSKAPGLILENIVTNLFEDDVIVCDVSGRNPNVMFELGLRMAFQKPVVVICDDITPFSFDINVIEHIKYPRTMHHYEIIEFQKRLSEAVPAAIDQGNNYMQRFGPTAKPLAERELQISDIAEQIAELRVLFSERRLYDMYASTANEKKKGAIRATEDIYSGQGMIAVHIEMDAIHWEVVSKYLEEILTKYEINRMANGRMEVKLNTYKDGINYKRLIKFILDLDSSATITGVL